MSFPRRRESNILRAMRILLTMLFAMATSAMAADGPDTWLLTGARIYVSPEERPIDDGAVLVQKGRIGAAGRRSDVSGRGASLQQACSGGFITAGFQNSHVHFIGEQWNGAASKPAAQLERSMTGMLTRYGYTTVVDIASDPANTLALRARVDRGEIPGPRILTAGWALFPPGGLPIYLEHFPREFLEKLPLPADAEAAARIVRENLDAGADATKLFLVTPQPRGQVARMPAQVARAAADETHRRGKPVFAHPTDIEGV